MGLRTVIGARGRTGHDGDLRRVLFARGARGLTSGYFAVILGVELHHQGVSGLAVGLVLGAVLGGSAFALLGVRRFADGVGRRRLYRGGYLAQSAAGLVLVLSPWWWLLVLVGLTGALSGEIIDSGPFGALEQVMLTTAVTQERRLRTFSRYGAVGSATGALGALGAGLLQLVGPGAIGRWSFFPIIPLALFGAACAWGLSARVEHVAAEARGERSAPASASRPAGSETRRIVHRLSALFALDSFGAGFTVQAFVAYWLAARFDASTLSIGIIFFGLGVLQTFSMMVAGRLGERFGLLATMVFTHLPSNGFLAAIAFAPSLPVAAVLLCLRASLSQMDVPTRNAYLMALVPARDRTGATSTAGLARLLARPIGPLLAGAAQTLALGAPFLISGALKGIYDVSLWLWFRRVPLPEGVEHPGGARPGSGAHPSRRQVQLRGAHRRLRPRPR